MRQLSHRSQKFRIVLLNDQAVSMSCQNARCKNYENGWAVVLDTSGDARHAEIARWIKDESGRRFFEVDAAQADAAIQRFADRGDLVYSPPLRELVSRTPAGMTLFLFPRYQQCFKPHRDREVVFRHDGYVHERPLDFNEDFNEQADRINTMLKRG